MKTSTLLSLLALLLLSACGGQTAPDDLRTIRLPMGYVADPQYLSLIHI